MNSKPEVATWPQAARTAVPGAVARAASGLAEPVPQPGRLRRWFGRFGIRSRLALIGVTLVAAALATGLVWIDQSRAQMMQQKRAELLALTDLAHGMVQSFRALEQSGEVDHATAQRWALEALGDLRYRNNDYFFVRGMDGMSVMHPTLPNLAGNSGAERTDLSGFAYVQRMMEIARNQDEGYVYYLSRGRAGQSLPKLAHVTTFQPWGWIIGTGVFIDDVDAALARASARLGIGIFLVTGFFGTILVLVGRSILTPIDSIVAGMGALRAGQSDIQIPTVSPGTDLGKLAAAMAAFRDNLLLNQRLQEQQWRALKEAQAANRAKSDFLAAMSHELRTPLNAILGFSELLQHQMKAAQYDERLAGYAGDIHSAGRHLLDLVNDILDLSRIEAGKHRIELETLDLRHELEELLRLIRDTTLPAGVQLTLSVHPEASHLVADRRALRQILLNLLSNSVKHVDESGAVNVETRPDPAAWVTISVSDNGCGIAERDVKRILQPFEQSNPHIASRQASSGLGLAVVKALMDLHCGRITIDSRLGKGTCVSLQFPAAGAPAAQAHRQ